MTRPRQLIMEVKQVPLGYITVAVPLPLTAEAVNVVRVKLREFQPMQLSAAEVDTFIAGLDGLPRTPAALAEADRHYAAGRPWDTACQLARISELFVADSMTAVQS